MNTPLPEAVERIWSSDAQAKLGSWIELAGGDVSEVFRSRVIENHPWLDLTLHFPLLEKAGFCNIGKVVRCLVHPRGELMFDVRFTEPVPPHQSLHDGYYIALANSPDHHFTEHRFRAHVLKAVAGVYEGNSDV
jgi:hypothetical protein